MTSSREEFDYTTGGDSRVMHKRKIGAGGYGDVHEVQSLPERSHIRCMNDIQDRLSGSYGTHGTGLCEETDIPTSYPTADG